VHITDLSREACAADDWFKHLDRMDGLLSRKRKAGDYNPVKLAILDSGIDSKSRYWNRIKEYKDFVATEKQEGIDNTGHGTTGVYLTLKVIPKVEAYVARVWESQKATKATPALVAEVHIPSRLL
jgi:hypothetical protein